jgi:hypothetical protein
MKLPSKSRFAFDCSVESLASGSKWLYLWTFTFPEALDVDVARKRWSRFLRTFNMWRRRDGRNLDLAGVRVFELHPKGHGLHIHVVNRAFWGVDSVRRLWQLPGSGGGRVHVKRIPVSRAHYAGKYLRKAARAECFKGVRMWAGFGGFGYCRVRDVQVESNWTRIYRVLRATLGRTFEQLRWWQRQCAVANVERDLPWHFGLIGCPGCTESTRLKPQFRVGS